MAQAILNDERDNHAGDRTEYRVYFFVAYPLFFAAALLGRLLPRSKEQAPRRSVFHEAADMAHSVIPWVFSGR